MPRPSLHVDQAMLASGRVLYPRHGCAGLSVRMVAEHAGVNPSLFHYHFGSKEQFLQALLQSLYEEMFEQLSGAARLPGPPLQRLRGVLLSVGGFLRCHGAEVGRIWADAGQGEAVAVALVRDNAPRHLRLVTTLLEEAEQGGQLRPMPALQRLVFLMGAVVAPVFVAGRLQKLDLGAALPPDRLEDEVLSEAAIAARADMAIAALCGREG
jgi:AcrR family transcriptional regulator